MKIITDFKKEDLIGKKVLVRVDFNVPIENGEIKDDFRIKQSLPTIRYLLENDAKVILMTHLGDDGSVGMALINDYLKKIFANSDSGQIKLLPNLRSNEGEKKNDLEFAKKLASQADIYVNDAFSVSHRAHASVSTITQFLPSYAGLRLAEEVEQLSKVLHPETPFVVILGGVKFQTKIPLVEKFLQTADKIFVVGALANSFMKASGCDVGMSVTEEDVEYIKPFLENKKVILPVDTIKNEKNQIVDVGPKSLEQIKLATETARTILWNGPTGWFETGYKEGTLAVAKIISESKVFSVIGGGDTLSAIRECQNDTLVSRCHLDITKFGFVSTGGGAMLDFLANDGHLPGLEALG